MTASAPRYTSRTLQLSPRDGHATVSLYRPDGQWPMYGAGPTRSQFQPGIQLRPPFRVVWSKYLRGLIEFPAVVADGVAYVSNAGGRLFALSMSNGRTIWELDLDTTTRPPRPRSSAGTSSPTRRPAACCS